MNPYGVSHMQASRQNTALTKIYSRPTSVQPYNRAALLQHEETNNVRLELCANLPILPCTMSA